MRQLVEVFALYLYLPRVAGPEVLMQAIRDGVALLTWRSDGFAYAEDRDEAAGRYRGLRAGQVVSISPDSTGFLVKPEVAGLQMEAEAALATTGGAADRTDGVTPDSATASTPCGETGSADGTEGGPPRLPRRFHGTVQLDPARVGRDAGRIAEEVIAHLSGMVGAKLRVTLEIEAEVPDGAPEHVVRTVTENSRTLKFTSQGFERD